MKSKRLLTLSGIIVAGPLFIIGLYYFSMRPNTGKNDFVRIIFPQKILLRKTYSYMGELPRIAAATTDSIILTDTTAGRLLLYHNLLDPIVICNRELMSKGKQLRPFRMQVSKGHCYLTSMNSGVIIDWDLYTNTVKTYAIGSSFNQAVFIGGTNFIIRKPEITNAGIHYTIGKLKTKENSWVESSQWIEQVDGGYSNDGMLHFDSTTRTLVYVPFYTNNITYLDTNLFLTRRGRTIDTISTATGKVVAEKVADTSIKWAYTFSSPPITTNRKSCVCNGNLFICSNMKADNEQEEFFKNDVIDVYSIINGQYLGSFYVPIFKGERSYDFRVYDKNKLVMVYQHQIILYQISFPFNG